jgi:hypothetical protein
MSGTTLIRIRAEPPGACGDTNSAGARRRSVTIWDISSILLAIWVVLSGTIVASNVFNEWLYRPWLVEVVAASTVLAGAAALCVAIVRERPAPRTIFARLTGVWRDPPGDWPAFVLGALLAAPLLGLYAPTLFTDSDSLRIVAAIRHVQRGNLGFLVETQDSFGPHMFLGPVLAVGGTEALRIVTIVSVQVLVGTVAWIARRASGSMVAAAIAALGLLSIPPVVERVLWLPMYPTMLALACVGSWLAYRAIVDDASWPYAVGAALCLVLAQEAQPVGQLFLAVPLLLLTIAPRLSAGALKVAHVYGFALVVLLPRLIVNLSEGGLRHLRSNRTDFWITEGYLGQIQRDFHQYSALDDSLVTYLRMFPERLVSSLGDFGWVALAFAILALVGLRGRARLFPVAWVGLLVAAMTVTSTHATPRYFSPLWPGIALLVGISTAWLLQRQRVAVRLLGVVPVILLAVVAASAFHRTGLEARRLTNVVEGGGYREAAELIDDGKGVLGGRAFRLLAIDTDIRTYGGQFLSEEEFVTFLTWPSDEAVIEVMERHDIGWVMSRGRVDVEYHNTWLLPNYGVPVRVNDRLPESPSFCRVFGHKSVILYKLGACPEDEAV